MLLDMDMDMDVGDFNYMLNIDGSNVLFHDSTNSNINNNQ